ncbi:MAG: AsnC family transcriptional regulator [Proteobacteria bacterium]|nr:AsnC family transcriptional regulator [Pseudomonadota bacterium]MBU1742315.1 AsnC family transcriptional regulator [Pseudomonadota bacterium]
MDDIDRRILNEIQSRFPLDTRPYLVLAERLGLGEDEVIARVKALRDEGIIRRIGGNFNSRALGYTSTLCAAAVPDEKMAAFVDAVNAHPGITHNYQRDHRYNVWFTVIAPSSADIRDILGEITRQTGVTDLISLPAEKIFKIKVDFQV